MCCWWKASMLVIFVYLLLGVWHPSVQIRRLPFPSDQLNFFELWRVVADFCSVRFPLKYLCMGSSLLQGLPILTMQFSVLKIFPKHSACYITINGSWDMPVWCHNLKVFVFLLYRVSFAYPSRQVPVWLILSFLWMAHPCGIWRTKAICSISKVGPKF